MFLKKHLRNSWPLWLSFLFPTIIMTAYFAYRQMAPFGSGSILTVDLGQQYVDFFAYFKHALINDPSSFLYSFSKAFGGEMMGVWAYYLMSPLNLILLLFPIKSLPSGILIILLLKYGFAGLSFGYLLKKSFTNLNHWLIPMLATAYALNGWMIANQLNIIWLDCMVLLPIIVLGMDRIIYKNKMSIYVISLTAMLIINYYMAYMICLFAILYFIATLIGNYHDFKTTMHSLFKWIIASITSAGLAACLLLPTFAALKDSKGVYTVVHYKWKFEYSPLNFFAKFFNGSFNFDEMPKGTPNIFVGSIVLVAFLMYFFNAHFNLKQKVSTGVVTVILILSMMLQPLDLLWHAMQFPIWYPYRFSFIFCFWLIWVAAQNLTATEKPLSWFSKNIVITILAVITFVIIMQQKKFQFLNVTNVVLGSVILLIAIGTLLIFNKRSGYIISTICLLTVAEMGLNVFNSLNNISYVTNDNYVGYTQNLKSSINPINQKDRSFFRVGKTFYRTKDDPFEANYNGGEHFSSTFEANTPNFMDQIGEPAGDGFIEYANGTLVSDSLLNFKYFVHQKNPKPNQYLQVLTDKPDLNRYRLINEANHVQTYQNPYALPIAFAGNNHIFKTAFSDDPMHYQSNLLNQLAGHKISNQLFKSVNFSSSSFVNTGSQNTITGSMFRRKDLLKPAHIILRFTPSNNNSYYLTIGSNITNKNALIKINGKNLNQYNVYRSTVAANVASKMKGHPIKIDIEMLKGNLWLQNLTLYQLNNQRFDKLVQQLQANPMKINSHGNDYFNGSISIKQKNQALITTIPYEKGWHLIANGKSVHVKKWANMFLGASLAPGKYQIKLYYWPPLLNVGLLISSITGLSIIIVTIYRRKRKQ